LVQPDDSMICPINKPIVINSIRRISGCKSLVRICRILRSGIRIMPLRRIRPDIISDIIKG